MDSDTLDFCDYDVELSKQLDELFSDVQALAPTPTPTPTDDDIWRVSCMHNIASCSFMTPFLNSKEQVEYYANRISIWNKAQNNAFPSQLQHAAVTRLYLTNMHLFTDEELFEKVSNTDYKDSLSGHNYVYASASNAKLLKMVSLKYGIPFKELISEFGDLRFNTCVASNNINSGPCLQTCKYGSLFCGTHERTHGSDFSAWKNGYELYKNRRYVNFKPIPREPSTSNPEAPAEAFTASEEEWQARVSVMTAIRYTEGKQKAADGSIPQRRFKRKQA